jgi:hypothetical protein
MTRFLRVLFGLRRFLFGAAKGPSAATRDGGDAGGARPGEGGATADPWLAGILGHLGERYQLGEVEPDGTRLLRRTGRARFNPMPVWLRSEGTRVCGDYEVRAQGATAADDARRLLDGRVSAQLARWGFAPERESIEEWAGTVLTRRYQGSCPDAALAAAAIHFMCVDSELQMNTAAE